LGLVRRSYLLILANYLYNYRPLNSHRYTFDILYYMITPKLIFLLALLTAIAITQVPPDLRVLTETTHSIVIGSHTSSGCALWNGTICEQCSPCYYLNTAGKCCYMSSHCQHFNPEVGICEKCYSGYVVSNGICQAQVITSAPQPVVQPNPGCLTFVNGTCTNCSVRYYLDSLGICQPVSDYCRTWDSSTGACLTCYNGYLLNS
jgi:hypothetical protein